ncbi:MAG: hypothetical protein E7E23_02305 [Paenibacillus sp.]|uniref:hypothetical protein n=1 Tax=Paenibacillus sp. TaxID=58172 RepID=UPI00290300B8|nr:hypothetical protein [Paenibacillus sp.]MDU2239383.1 hypothetical protein [Paenibacillus sp.]
MEENAVVETWQPQPQPEPSPKKKLDLLSIISLSLAAVAVLAAVGMWYFTNNSMTKRMDELTAKLESETAAIRQENELLKATMQAQSDQIGAMETVVFFNAIAREIEGATVTDDFTVDKIYLNTSETGTLGSIVINVGNQPDMSYLYKGKGAYNLSDRELRAKCETIIKEVSARYGTGEMLPAWDDNTLVTVTVLNYEIGSKQGGEFKLVGETK